MPGFIFNEELKAVDGGSTILWAGWGPLVRYDGKFLRIEDINPEIKITWAMTRWELVRFGLRCIRVALWRAR